MNERIQKLIGKTLDSEFSHTWDTMTYEGLLQFSEKFAELIIFECTKVAIFKDSGMVASADVAGYMAAGRSTAARMIREHFEVEE
jgi:hypothetical protein